VPSVTAETVELGVVAGQVELQLQSHPLHQPGHVQDVPDGLVDVVVQPVNEPRPVVGGRRVVHLEAVARLPVLRQHGRAVVDRPNVTRLDGELEVLEPRQNLLAGHRFRTVVAVAGGVGPALEQLVLRGVRLHHLGETVVHVERDARAVAEPATHLALVVLVARDALPQLVHLAGERAVEEALLVHVLDAQTLQVEHLGLLVALERAADHLHQPTELLLLQELQEGQRVVGAVEPVVDGLALTVVVLGHDDHGEGFLQGRRRSVEDAVRHLAAQPLRDHHADGGVLVHGLLGRGGIAHEQEVGLLRHDTAVLGVQALEVVEHEHRRGAVGELAPLDADSCQCIGDLLLAGVRNLLATHVAGLVGLAGHGDLLRFAPKGANGVGFLALTPRSRSLDQWHGVPVCSLRSDGVRA